VKIEQFNLPSLPLPALFDASVRVLGVAIAAGAIILASRWLTELTSPRPVARLASAALVQPETSIKTFDRLFGANETRPEAVEGLRLTGVFAGSKGGGFATFLTRTGAVSVFSGDEVVPGVRLKQIERDRVILLTADAKRELLLSENREPGAGTPVQATATPAQTAATPAQAAAAPAQVYGYSIASRRRNAQRTQEEE
jgi:type II secretory pathway component PulC